MIRRPPRSTQSRSSAASDVYKRQVSIPGIVSGVPDITQCDLPGRTSGYHREASTRYVGRRSDHHRRTPSDALVGGVRVVRHIVQPIPHCMYVPLVINCYLGLLSVPGIRSTSLLGRQWMFSPSKPPVNALVDRVSITVTSYVATVQVSVNPSLDVGSDCLLYTSPSPRD